MPDASIDAARDVPATDTPDAVDAADVADALDAADVVDAPDAPHADPPRPIAPLSTATVTSQTPVLRWELTPRTDGASVELCRDRAFARSCQTLDATGTQAAPATALTPGVWFWRLHARSGGSVEPGTGPVWEFTVGARSAAVNTSWGTTLDVNGDGYADLAVGNGPTAYIYLGRAAGLASTPDIVLTDPGSSETFGNSIASAGDVNGDGYADLVVGTFGGSSGGHAYVYLGSAAGLANAPATTLSASAANEGLATSVAGAGDVNGDGYADVVVGAIGGTDQGHAYLYLGSAAGLTSTPAGLLTSSRGVAGSYGGLSVASAGDVNGDGYADVVVGDPRAASGVGQALVYLGSAAGLASAPATTLVGLDGADGAFGYSVANAGDVNGDGYADLAVGAPGAQATRGRAYVYLGGAAGPASMPATTLGGPTGPSDVFAYSMGGAGDVNGDGFADLAVGAPSASRAHVYLGSTSGLASMPATTIDSDPYGVELGWSVAGAGDLDGDGFADLAVSATHARTRTRTGAVYVYRGGAAGIATAAAATLTRADDFEDEFGRCVATADDLTSYRNDLVPLPGFPPRPALLLRRPPAARRRAPSLRS